MIVRAPQSLFTLIDIKKESNRGLLHCRWILYQLSYQGSPYKEQEITFCGLQILSSFSNFSVHKNHLEIWLKCIFIVLRSGVASEIVHF